MRKVLLSMPFFRRNWGEVKYNLSRVTQLIVIERTPVFVIPNPILIITMHYSHRHLSCYILFMSLPVLASNRAMSLSSWHSPWNGCWVWWHLAPQPFKATLRKGIENLILPLCTCLGDVWTYGGGLRETSVRGLSSESRQLFWFGSAKKLLIIPSSPKGNLSSR